MEAVVGFLTIVVVIWLIRAASRRPHDAWSAYRFSEIKSDPNWQHGRTIRTKIKGVSYRNPDGSRRQKIIRDRCHAGDALLLVREPNNPVDQNAIQISRIVCKENRHILEEQLGYVSRELAEDLAPRMDAGSQMFAKITTLTGDVAGTQQHSVGVNIEIEEYKPCPTVWPTDASRLAIGGPMSYCTQCGQAIQEGAKFCSACGATVSSLPPAIATPGAAAAAPAPATKVIAVEPRRGGRLALKGFLIAFGLSLIFNLATSKADTIVRSTGMVIAFAVGVGYIIMSLRKWERRKEVVRGAGIGWAVAAFMILICIGGLASLASSGGNRSSSAASISTSTDSSVSTIQPKDVLLRDVKLNFRWSKGAFGNVMLADFTIKNPTQYRFKDFEIKCTHSAASGTVIDSNTRTVYEIVEPKSTKVIRQMNMGFIHSQAAQSGCQITDLVPML
jgi:hypothetical protein